jgi:uroporphyrinogen-III synthase
MSFAGKRVLSLESRRAQETAELIRRNGGEPLVAPSMREVPIESNEEAFGFAERLFAGDFDTVIFLTGVGTRYLAKVLATRYGPERFPEALRKVKIAARGPKPVAALREMNVPVHVTAPEPNTWRELVAALEGIPARRIAVQLYGKSNPEFIEALERRGAEVTPVHVYEWMMPEDLGPLRTVVGKLAEGAVDVTMFTTSMQLVHLLEVAREMQLHEQVAQAIRASVIASIGPTTSEALRENGFDPDLEPSHPKLGILVKETAEQAETILQSKRQ